LDCLIRAVMLNPRSWTTLTVLGGVYLRLGAREMAAQALEQARGLQPLSAEVLTALAEVYAEEREYEVAKQTYLQALALDETSAAAAEGLGLICASIGEDEEAARGLEHLVERGIHSIEVLLRLANLPRSLVSVDVLAAMDSVVRDPAD